ncbi:hypothetical protein BDN72DRAFT_790751 [Pluteus cervinus]|uniref:Uncharacterized protein n=1 Tax=Pluteus cervinus TaxID=181527 RepID=A0ACD3B5S1_9AGAR|nr:hypothetical protein BDN72DRAFT_790751 [Pluteus cervinus]
MAILMPHHTSTLHSHKHLRRNATAIMAGVFDVPSRRDVLTSLLNGVPVYKAVERDEEYKRNKRKEKKERDRERKRQKTAEKRQASESAIAATTPSGPVASTSSIPKPQPITAPTWHSRPAIHIPALQRSLSVTPPPCTSPIRLQSSPASTPGPSISSSTSRTSSKRPHTPDDDDDDDEEYEIQTAPPAMQADGSRPPRRKRVAVKKGWKGWVEGSPPPSEKLINLDATPVLRERRTRSGKHFAGVGPGRDEWV